ncbi:replication-relaxation family protein [Catenulispora pinisilvae]|uniref:replication-relaxation family protein n=1 Tax=Catenulispora pinisilvae TaxID=2705253 RepID=UPI002B26FC97|nr:replication-relaxation family protein [Catenulispora pinisilvae]
MTPNRHALLVAANRLTERDRRILRLLGHHQVLTTHQITRAFFDNPRVARRRVQILADVGLVDCFRPPLLIGTSPKHCVLTPLGLHSIFGLDDAGEQPAPRAGDLDRIVLRADLRHLVGVNDVFCALHGAARTMADASLEMWWSERACTKAWGSYIRPDGFGRWHEGSRTVDFFLEYDTGVEHSPQILAKLPGYEAVAATTGIVTPVLFWLHSPRREQALHQRLTRSHHTIPIATAVGDSANADPSSAIWRRVGANSDARVSLIDLAGEWA